MMKIKRILLSGLCIAAISGYGTQLSAFEEGDWLYSTHVNGNLGNFNTPFGLTVTVTDDPEPPAPVIPVVPNVPEPEPELPPVEAPDISASNRQTVNYRDMYGIPVSFGLDIGYMATDNLEVFFGYQFLRAQGKKFLAHRSTINNVQYSAHARLKSYDAHNGHVGVRYYFKCHTCFTPYIGVKLGGAQNKQGNIELALDNGVTIGGLNKVNVNGMFNTIGFVGGPQFGIDYRLNENFSAFLGMEALYKTSFYADTRPNLLLGASPTAPKLQAQVTQFGTNLWAFPFTFGIRYRR